MSEDVVTYFASNLDRYVLTTCRVLVGPGTFEAVLPVYLKLPHQEDALENGSDAFLNVRRDRLLRNTHGRHCSTGIDQQVKINGRVLVWRFEQISRIVHSSSVRSGVTFPPPSG